MLKRWNLGLIIGTFLLSIFGTFITRSGRDRERALLHPVERRATSSWRSSCVAAVLSFTLLYTRWPLLEAEVQLESMLSREAAFLFNNLLLVGIAFSVLWGTLFPILSEAVRGTKITVGPAVLQSGERAARAAAARRSPGIGPLIAWRKASTANLRRQFVAPVATGRRRRWSRCWRAGMRDFYALDGPRARRLRGRARSLQEFYRGVRARRRMHRRVGPGGVRSG